MDDRKEREIENTRERDKSVFVNSMNFIDDTRRQV